MRVHGFGRTTSKLSLTVRRKIAILVFDDGKASVFIVVPVYNVKTTT